MANENKYRILSSGALAHSAIENMICDEAIDMGDAVSLVLTPILSDEIQPRVIRAIGFVNVYGIAVGGDADGIYGDGSASTSDVTRATTAAGQTVRIITRGRCPARVNGVTSLAVSIGDRLVASGIPGVFQKTPAAIRFVAAIALNNVAVGDTDMIVVEMVKEGLSI